MTLYFKIPRYQLLKLYEGGLSARQIGEKFQMTVWQVTRLLKKYNIPRRSFTDANNARFLAKPPSFFPLKKLTARQRILKTAGLVLYWAEGHKRASFSIDFANSDPESIKVFTKFLRQIYQVSESRLRAAIYCYSNQSVKQLTQYWSSITDIPIAQFTKPFIRTDFRLEKVGRMPYGLIHIRYSDKKLLQRILADICTLQSEILAGYRSGQPGVAVISSSSRKLELKN